MKEVAKSEKELGLTKMSQLEQESRFMQLKEDLVRQQSIEKVEIQNGDC
ncbi:hypothetical protein SPBRAN_1303 [uncultured Candidatus Thioglobus sp.]|nr:hypothetical protein SPBRAN_1303 [uncultured Candidatus Thioglobus sp.]